MHYTELKQKRFWEKKSFKLTDEGIEIYNYDFESEFTNFFSYEDIEYGAKPRLHTVKQSLFILFGGFSFILAILTFPFSRDIKIKDWVCLLLLILLGMIMFGLFFFCRRKYYILNKADDSSMGFFFMQSKPNEATVNSFFSDLFENQREYYRRKYFLIDKDENLEDELKKMKWLRNKNIITQSEYELMHEEIHNLM